MGLRCATLGLQSFDQDETVTVWLTHLPLGGMLATIPRTESTPPLYYMLVWGWTRLAGTSAVGIRALSAVIGVATIAVIYLAAAEAAGRRAGAIAAVLTAVSPALVWYSQEARAAALLVLLSAASLLFFIRVVREAGARGASLALWALASTLALASHYFALFVLVPEALLLFVAAGTPPARRRALLAGGAVGLAGLVLLPLAVRQNASGGANWIARTPLGDRLLDVPPQLLLGEGRPHYHYFALALGLAMIAPLVLLLIRGAHRRVALTLLTIGLCGIVLPTLLDLAGMRILADRNLLAVIPPLLIACALGMARCRPAPLAVLAASGALALSAWALIMVSTNSLLQREDWRDAARALGPASSMRAVIYGPATTNPAPTPRLVPFQAVYLKSLRAMPDAGATVSEIDELDVRDDLSASAPPPNPVSPGPGFRLIGRVGKPTFTLFRYASPEPVRVTSDQLIGLNLLENRDRSDEVVGLQAPGPAAEGAREPG